MVLNLKDLKKCCYHCAGRTAIWNFVITCTCMFTAKHFSTFWKLKIKNLKNLKIHFFVFLHKLPLSQKRLEIAQNDSNLGLLWIKLKNLKQNFKKTYTCTYLKRLEIEQNLEIRCMVNVHSKTIFQHFENFNFQKK